MPYAQCLHFNVDVPNRLAIAAITDSDVLRATTPPITALDLHPDRIGATAIELLVALIEDGGGDDRRIVPSDLLMRGSTDRIGGSAGPEGLTGMSVAT